MQKSLIDYADQYRHVRMSRQDGILEVRLHSDAGPLVWGDGPHSELGHCFADIAADPHNRVVILTGTGDAFCSMLDDSWTGPMHPAKWDRILTNGKRLLGSLLDIGVPVVGVVNGPARIHAELVVLSDIVIATEETYFQDLPHFRFGTVPGDGVHVLWPMLLGPNRGRHFLLSGAKISSEEALRLGVVAEVQSAATALDRGWAIARDLASRPDVTLRYARAALTQHLKRALLDGVGFGLALEGLAAYETWPGTPHLGPE